MPHYIPVKNLIKLNWTISLMVAVLSFIFVAAVTHDLSTAFLRFLQTFIFIGLTSFFNLAVMNRLSRHQQEAGTPPIKFYLISYPVVIVIWLLVKELYCLYTGLKWEGEGDNLIQAYSLAILAIWVMNTLVITLQNLVILIHTKANAKIENLQLKANVSETANLLLRQQIHPHFLFNALNTVKSLYKRDLQQGEEYLVHLANFLRASISNHKSETTLIKNELEFCMDYLKMQKIRFGDALNYTVQFSEQTVQNLYLPYFSLQPLVENALKHNDLTEERPIAISIREHEGYVYVTNNVQLRAYREPSTGQGLSNLAERYRLLGQKDISIHSDNDTFTVCLKILEK